MFHLLIFVIFIGVLGVLIFDFLSRKKTEINGAHVLVRFPVFFFGGKFRALHVTTASLQFCCYFFRLLADQVVLEKRWLLRWLSVELTWLSWREIWLELPEWSWYRAVTVYKVHRTHTGEDKTWTPTLDRVHGPLSWTGSMDPLSWTRSMDSFF